MKVDFLQDPTTEAMGRYMTRLARRQELVASNLANIDTPGFRTKDISFHATMQELLGRSEASPRLPSGRSGRSLSPAAAPSEPEVFEVTGLPERADRNNVDLDQEMMKLGRTTFGYGLMAQLLRAKFRMLAGAINDGRGY